MVGARTARREQQVDDGQDRGAEQAQRDEEQQREHADAAHRDEHQSAGARPGAGLGPPLRGRRGRSAAAVVVVVAAQGAIERVAGVDRVALRAVGREGEEELAVAVGVGEQLRLAPRPRRVPAGQRRRIAAGVVLQLDAQLACCVAQARVQAPGIATPVDVPELEVAPRSLYGGREDRAQAVAERGATGARVGGADRGDAPARLVEGAVDFADGARGVGDDPQAGEDHRCHGRGLPDRVGHAAAHDRVVEQRDRGQRQQRDEPRLGQRWRASPSASAPRSPSWPGRAGRWRTPIRAGSGWRW